jgi:uncharacterized protein with ParB-like and HNH nuclease domain
MVTQQKIESLDLSLGKVFSDFYVVPSYQREYVWEDAEVEQLLLDIHDEYSENGPGDSEYFIGSIVVTPTEDGTFELIDGQQRITTAFLVLCSIRDRLAELAPESSREALNAQIAATDTDDLGRDIFRYRVELQYEDSSRVLEHVAEQGPGALDREPTTRSVKNILDAYRFIGSFLRTEFGDDEDDLRRFYAYLTKRVKLIRVGTGSVAHALKVFETINDRGVGLDSMDLLKNLMFMQATSAQFDELKNEWKTLVDTLFGKEKPLRFLRYFIFATYNVERLKEDEIYSWFVKNGELCGYVSDPVGFVKELRDAAKVYALFVDGKDPRGKANRYLTNLRYLSGAARQHFILLLAGRHLSPDLFTDLARHLENLYFAYIITREPTKEFERRFALWAQELRAVDSENGFEAFISRRFDAAKEVLAARYRLAFLELNESSIQRYRMRYVLGKLAQHIDEMAWAGKEHITDLSHYVSSGTEVEHILPQNPSQEALHEFDRVDLLSEYVHKLGNLTPLEKPINASVGNGPFGSKIKAYRQSNFLLTKSLAEPIEVGKNTAVDRAVRDLEGFETWYAKDIERRQEMLGRLALKVWDMPEPAGS